MGNGFVEAMRGRRHQLNPTPGAEERLRRLFTILLRLADPASPIPGSDPSAALIVMGLGAGSSRVRNECGDHDGV